MYESEKYHGVSLEQSKVAYSTLLKLETKCNYELSQQDEEQSDYTQISPLNMSFPIFFWGIFSIIAIIVQIVFVWKTKKGKDSMILGRASSYDLFAKSYRTVKKTSLVNKNSGDDAVNSCATVAIPSKSDGPSSYDLENRLTESVIEPISTFHELDVSQNNLIDDFDENSHAPPILASSADPLKRRKKVTFHTGSDSNCSEREYDITCRMERLVETGAVAEFFECFQELKKIKGK